jgi:hypothetical protein
VDLAGLAAFVTFGKGVLLALIPRRHRGRCLHIVDSGCSGLSNKYAVYRPLVPYYQTYTHYHYPPTYAIVLPVLMLSHATSSSHAGLTSCIELRDMRRLYTGFHMSRPLWTSFPKFVCPVSDKFDASCYPNNRHHAPQLTRRVTSSMLLLAYNQH